MSKKDLVPAKLEDFAYWINERMKIWCLRKEGRLKPWSDDEIFQKWKFTNVYRQLDKGTIWLHKMLEGQHDPELIIFNVIWYRLFNRWEHARNLGFVGDYESVENYMNQCHRQGTKIFTSAYMTTGVEFEDKYISYLRACKEIWRQREFIHSLCRFKSMEVLYNKLLQFYMVGKFVSYELVCDLRFTDVLRQPIDRMTWCNLGPGAIRGLKRLGRPVEISSCVDLMAELGKKKLLEDWVYFGTDWPFELREIEHSLCEFDKYQRVKSGAGRPRQKYDGLRSKSD
jgi:hypothetical protein